VLYLSVTVHSYLIVQLASIYSSSRSGASPNMTDSVVPVLADSAVVSSTVSDSTSCSGSSALQATSTESASATLNNFFIVRHPFVYLSFIVTFIIQKKNRYVNSDSTI